MTEFVFVVELEDQFVKIGHFEILGLGNDTRVSKNSRSKSDTQVSKNSQSTFLKDGFRSSLNLRG
jgi:hypothetical protein